jgi:hypothetical protein
VLTLKRVRDLSGAFPNVVLEVRAFRRRLSTAPNRQGRRPGDRDGQYLAGDSPRNCAIDGHVQVNRMTRVVMCPPHYLKKSLDFLSAHMRYRAPMFMTERVQSIDFNKITGYQRNVLIVLTEVLPSTAWAPGITPCLASPRRCLNAEGGSHAEHVQEYAKLFFIDIL